VKRSELQHFGEATLELLALPKEQRVAYGRAARERILTAFAPEHEAAVLRGVLNNLNGLIPAV
jgi:hypothetical protein